MVGVAPAEDGVAVARVVCRNERAPRVESCAWLPYAGPADLAATVSQWVAAQGLRGAPCVGVLASQVYQLLQVEPPEVPAAELREAMRWRIRELVDFPVEDAVVDLFDISAENLSRRTAYVVAAAGDVIDRQVAHYRETGLGLRALDIGELALRNIAARLPENEGGVALLHIEREESRIGLYRQSELLLSRTISTGWARLGGVGAAADGGLALAADESLLDAMMLEIQRSLDYYESHFGQGAINTLVLLPSVEPVPALVAHLEQGLAVQVQFLDPESLVDWHTLPDPVELARCLVALGGALREAV